MSLPALTLNAWLRYDVVRRHLREMPDVRTVLEVGAGQGALATRLASAYDYTGLELDEVSHAAARDRLARVGRGRVLLGDLSVLGPDERFDLVCAFEVLEHIEDDLGALRSWRDRLRPGGWLLLSVPAFQERFAAADRMAGHFRRYDHAAMRAVLGEAGFGEADIRTYGGPLGYGLEAARNLVAKRREVPDDIAGRTAGSGRLLQPPESWGVVTMAATAPFRVAQRPLLHTRFGTGLVVRARRTG